VKKWRKSTKKCESYSQKSRGTFFPGHGVDPEAAKLVGPCVVIVVGRTNRSPSACFTDN